MANNIQTYFAAQMKVLEAYRIILAQKNINSRFRREATEKIQSIQVDLWNHIEKYALSVINHFKNKYMSNDTEQDMLQECAEIFFEKLDAYNPEKCTPTTYFKPYFYEVASKYARDCMHMTQYEYYLFGKLDDAYFELYTRNRRAPTYEELSCETKLSVKVCSRYSELDARQLFASIDPIGSQLIDFSAYLDRKMFRKELIDAVRTAISRNLTARERLVLLAKLNLDENKPLAYPVVAEKLGLSVREIKDIYNSAVCKIINAVQC